jgi:hypothetical protein
MSSSQGEDPETAQHVEVPSPIVVEEIAALATYVETIKAEGLDDLGQLGVEVALVQLEVLAVTSLK